MQSVVLGFGVFALIVALFYNFLIGRRNQVDNVFAGLEVQLKKRYDLIPSLVALTKKALEHERHIFEHLSELREKGLRAHSIEEISPLHGELSQALSALHVKVEAYPELSANANVLELQQRLAEVEEYISAARRAYNQSVTDYNNAIEMIPANVLARLLGYTRKQVFEASPFEREKPSVPMR
ncbi:MAG: LemA family protein [Campylobacterales bacterium]|nr:LemA family protein [Campylobacterales bacterium]